MKRILLFSAFALCVLYPYLTTGYYQDDSINSLTYSILNQQNLSLARQTWNSMHHWVTHEGRVFPLLALTYSFWYFVRDQVAYRVIQVSLVLSNILLFMALIRAVGGGKRLALLFGLIVLGLFQLRDFHDPISSYAAMMQISLGMGTAALLFLRRFQESSKQCLLYTSLALYACNLLYYEAGIAFFPILFYFALKGPRPNQARFVSTWGHTFLTAFYLGSVALVRLLYPVVYPGIQVQLGLKTVRTFLYQGLGAFPAIYAIFGRSGFYSLETLSSAEFLSWSGLAILIAGTAFLFTTLRLPKEVLPHQARRCLLVLGWSLFLWPTILISISQKYQNEITRPGTAYLPVYLSYFGIALLLALALSQVKRIKQVSVSLGMMIAFTFVCNGIAADRLNTYWKYPRDLIQKEARKGAFLTVPEGSLIVMNNTYNWASPDFYYGCTGKKFRTAGAEFYLSKTRTPGANEFFLNVQTPDGENGTLSLDPILKIEPSTGPNTPPRIVTAASNPSR